MALGTVYQLQCLAVPYPVLDGVDLRLVASIGLAAEAPVLDQVSRSQASAPLLEAEQDLGTRNLRLLFHVDVAIRSVRAFTKLVLLGL
jgi:hypothetical protein